VEPDREELLFSQVGGRLARASGLANGIGAIVVFLYMAVLPRIFAGTTALAAGRPIDPVLVAVFVAYFVVSGVAGSVTGRRLARPLVTWGERGGAPTEAERDGALRQPLLQATNGLFYWGAAALLFSGLVLVRPWGSPSAPLITLVGIGLAGLTVWLVAFLLVEREMRPITAIALAASNLPPGRSGLNVRTKLFLTWALGAGIPLLGIAGIPLLARDAIVPLAEVLVVVGLGVGAFLVLNTARSVADPISRVTTAMDGIAEGDLDTHVDVDDASEVGRLQAGFNRMVGGLKERAVLEDLFGRHVGIDVARHELERGAGLGGELREMSALFVDVVGSTTVAQTRSATAVVAMLNALFSAVARCAEAEGGWVNKFEGDAALVVVGVPQSRSDHAARALRIATALRNEVTELARVHEDLDVGIGVSSGMAVAGNVGAENRYEYTVIGDPVNEAARLSDAAKSAPGRVLASAATVDAAGTDGSRWQEFGELALRGRAQPTRSYQPN
jgi:adenylate cyclase